MKKDDVNTTKKEASEARLASELIPLLDALSDYIDAKIENPSVDARFYDGNQIAKTNDKLRAEFANILKRI